MATTEDTRCRRAVTPRPVLTLVRGDENTAREIVRASTRRYLRWLRAEIELIPASHPLHVEYRSQLDDLERRTGERAPSAAATSEAILRDVHAMVVERAPLLSSHDPLGALLRRFGDDLGRALA